MLTFVDAYPHLMGGAQVLTVRLAAELRRRDVEVFALTAGDGPLVESLRGEGIDCVPVAIPGPLRVYGHRTTGRRAAAAAAALPAFWTTVARHLPASTSLVHANDLRALVLAGPPARRRRMPVLWHVHSLEESVLNRLAGALASAVVVPSQAALEAMPAAVRRRAAVVPSAVSPPAVGAAQVDPRLVVTVGRISEEKGIDVLAEAARLMPAVRFEVLGQLPAPGDPYRRRVEGYGSVHLAGYVADAAERVAQAAVYVQSSRRETFGMAAVEAMHLGRPVVASAVGGLAELIQNGVNGLLVPPDDPPALAGAIRSLLDDPARAAALGRAGQSAVAGRFTLGAMVEGLSAVYKSISDSTSIRTPS